MDPFESIFKEIREYESKIEAEKRKPRHEQDSDDILRWERNIKRLEKSIDAWTAQMEALTAKEAALTAEKAALTRKMEVETELAAQLGGLSLSNGGLLALYSVSFH